MATLTPNLGLRKPDVTDLVNVVSDIDGNMDILDAAVTPVHKWQAGGAQNFAQFIPDRGVGAQILFNVVNYDDSANFDVTTGLFTVPGNGVYDISSTVTLQPAAAGFAFIALQKNGVSVRRGTQDALGAFAGGGNPSLHVSAKVHALTGDKLGINVFQNSGGAIQTIADVTLVYFDVVFIRAF